MLQIGMQAYRLGVHYWHLQRVEDAIKMLGRALKHLEITHGPEHGMFQVKVTRLRRFIIIIRTVWK
jgi:hypothetical protein